MAAPRQTSIFEQVGVALVFGKEGGEVVVDVLIVVGAGGGGIQCCFLKAREGQVGGVLSGHVGGSHRFRCHEALHVAHTTTGGCDGCPRRRFLLSPQHRQLELGPGARSKQAWGVREKRLLLIQRVRRVVLLLWREVRARQ